MVDTERGRWPSIPVDAWLDTRDTLHLYTQVVGKVRMANEPLLNHWWNVPLYVSARGLTTSLMPHPNGVAFQIDFDFVDHRVLDPDASVDFYEKLGFEVQWLMDPQRVDLATITDAYFDRLVEQTADRGAREVGSYLKRIAEEFGGE